MFRSTWRGIVAGSLVLWLAAVSARGQGEAIATLRISSLPHGCVGVSADRLHVLEWFDLAKAHGLDGVEVMDFWVMPGLMQRSDHELMGRIERKLAELHLPVSAFINHGPHVWPTAEQNRREMEKARFFMDWSRVLGTKVFRVTTCLMGGAKMSDAEAQEVFAGMIRELLPYASQRGLVIALEEHPGFAGTVVKMQRILDKVPDRRFGIKFDAKNTLREGEDPLSILKNRTVLDRVIDTHLDNFRRVPAGGTAARVTRVGDALWDRSVTLSAGDVDIAALVGGLKQHGYRGWLTVEYGGANLEHVFQSVAWLRSLWPTLPSPAPRAEPARRTNP